LPGLLFPIPVLTVRVKEGHRGRYGMNAILALLWLGTGQGGTLGQTRSQRSRSQHVPTGKTEKKALCVFLIVTFIAISTLSAWAEGFELKGNTGKYSVDVKLGQTPPVNGDNDISISVKDEASKPVTDARVDVEYLMPTYGGRPPMMDYKTTTEFRDGAYRGRLNLPMAGEWRVMVRIVRGGEGEMVGFTFVVP
jgi:hypothetical protein